MSKTDANRTADDPAQGSHDAVVARPLRVVNDGLGEDPRAEIPELGFREYWYPVVGVEELSTRSPLRVDLLGERLCVLKGRSGPAVLSDVCPHRGASLSAGRCHYRGTVSCPYHGWTFDETGACVAVLSEGPTSNIPGRVGVRQYPTKVIGDVLFVWMGQSEPATPERDLPPELFDGSVVFHDETRWPTNWRVALENMNDNHVRYVHRNALQLLMLPFGKISLAGARSIINGGGVRLTTYADDSLRSRPYREWFPGVSGYWPKHRYRLAWTWLFDLKPFRWIALTGSEAYQEEDPPHPYLGETELAEEWNQGPHMPGMMRIDMGGLLYTRWCVPVDRDSTRLFYLYAARPRNRRELAFLRYLKNPITWRLLHTRNLGLQDGGVLQETRYDTPERFSAFDVETAAWRRLAILSARHGGRHDRIPPDVIRRMNRRATGVDEPS